MSHLAQADMSTNPITTTTSTPAAAFLTILSSLSPLTIIATTLAIGLAIFFSTGGRSVESIKKWANFRYSLYTYTFGLYMFTPTERTIVNTVVLLLFTLCFSAAYYYLPRHLSALIPRLYYYISGPTKSGTGPSETDSIYDQLASVIFGGRDAAVGVATSVPA